MHMVQQNRQYSGGMEDDNKNCATGRYKGTFDSILLGHCIVKVGSWVPSDVLGLFRQQEVLLRIKYR